MNRVFKYVAVLLVIVNGLFPAIWLLLTSFKTDGELRQLPITYLPENFTLQNYVSVFSGEPLRALFTQFGGGLCRSDAFVCTYSPDSPDTRSGGSICRDAVCC